MCLANITAEVHTPVVAGGTENWVPGTIEHLAAPLVGMWLVTAGDITDCLALTADRSCYCATPAWSPPLPSARPHDHTLGPYHSRLRPRVPAAGCRCGPENGLVRQETFKMIIRSEVVGCGCRSELTATITTVVSR